MSSVDSMSLDEHIEIKIPEARVRENRLMAQNNFIQHINEKSRNISHTHLAVENEIPKNHSVIATNNVRDKEHMNRSQSHSNMKKMHASTNGITPMMNGHDKVEAKIKK